MITAKKNTPDRRWMVPEVIQSSAMDCGPASLKCLLEGFQIPVSYGRLREACQTDVDGTSIDTLEETAVQLGLDAEQIMIPLDHLFLPEAPALPALIVVRLASGNTHFVVAWNQHGPFVQVMDPAKGRRWPTVQRFLEEVYIHTFPVPSGSWRTWAGSDEFIVPLRARLAKLVHDPGQREELIGTAVSDAGWRALASLDAATRMVGALVRSGGLECGPSTAKSVRAAVRRAMEQAPDDPFDAVIPDSYWSVRRSPDTADQLLLRGAVLIRVRGRRTGTEPAAPLIPELAAALDEKPVQPFRELFRMLAEDGLFGPITLLLGMILTAGLTILETLLYRGIMDMNQVLPLPEQRFVVFMGIIVFLAILTGLDVGITAGVLRLGRYLEIRLRVAFLEKIPRLGDRYFRSRLTSDMAERSHSIYKVRGITDLGRSIIYAGCQIVFITLAIIWFDPASAPAAILGVVLGIGIPLMARPLIQERDLRVRSLNGTLSHFYLDGLLGLVPIRTHGASRAVRREYDILLKQWVRARLGLQAAQIGVNVVHYTITFAIVIWIVLDYLARGGAPAFVLLLVYWAFSVEQSCELFAQLVMRYPTYRNLTLRLIEPLGAPEEEAQTAPALAPTPGRGVSILLADVTVRAAGHTILDGIHLTVEPGEHIAIVGPSGAGKSSLVGILLGWHDPAQGQVLVDGQPFDHPRLEQLRRETAWVDPSVQLWNRSLLDNLHYGIPPAMVRSTQRVIEQADLGAVLGKFEQDFGDGFSAPLGEGGGLVSGGEGQRIRLARALLRPGVRLVILDEPFRGLDRDQRRELLRRARAHWNDVTLICITHDVGETQHFERVIVMEQGQIVEDGSPLQLAHTPGSHYAGMLKAEHDVREGLWKSLIWRQLWIKNGRLSEKAVEEPLNEPS